MAPRTRTNGHAAMTAEAADIALIDGSKPVLEEHSMTDISQTSDPTVDEHPDTPVDEPTATTVDAAPTPETPVYGDPFTLPETGWATNRVIMVGEIVPPRERSGNNGKKKRQRGSGPMIQANDGNVYQVLTVTVNTYGWQTDESAGMDGLGGVTRLEVLVSPQHPLMKDLARTGGTVALEGRMQEVVSRNRREENQRVVIDGGVWVQRQEALIVQDLRVVDPHTPHYVVGHLTGTVQKVLRMDVPLDPRTPDERYHVVQLAVTEQFPRRAPARGMIHTTTTVTVYVPSCAPESGLLLRRGNQVSLEYAVTRIVSWRADRALETIKPDVRDRARTHMRDEVIVTAIEGDAAATPLSDEEHTALTARVTERQRTRTAHRRAAQQRRREQAQSALAETVPEADASMLEPAVMQLQKPRRKAQSGASGIPSLTTGGA